MLRLPNLTKTPRNEIRSILWGVIKPPLQAAGFEMFTSECAFRYHENRVDIVELRMANPGRNAPYRMPPNNFEIEAGVFFKFAPHPMGASFDGVEGLALKNVSDAHMRISSYPNLLLRDSLKSAHWRVDIWGMRKKRILSDVEQSINNYFVPWFAKFGDLNAVRSHILNVFETGGGHQTRERSPDSWGWVYGFKTLPAFFALYFGDWAEAKSRLTALLAEPHPGHKDDPNKFPEKLYHTIEPMLRESLAKAEAHW